MLTLVTDLEERGLLDQTLVMHTQGKLAATRVMNTWFEGRVVHEAKS